MSIYRSIYDLRDFYNQPMGQWVCRIVRRMIGAWWPSVHGQRVAGIGYACPYLDLFVTESERCIAIMPAAQGALRWPFNDRNLTVLSEESELPLETSSVDRVVLVHSLEHAELIQANLQEISRVLKGDGKLLIIVPNRTGFWSRAEWSPFGRGTPYSMSQLRIFLRDNLFVHERTKPFLYVPPLRWNWVVRIAPTLEKIGPWLFPAFAGLYIVEASKQVYAGIDVPVMAKGRVRGRRAAMQARTAPVQSRIGIKDV